MNSYSFGQLKNDQAKALRPHVDGKVVYDLGAGALGMAYTALRLGAKHVLAVDLEYKSAINNVFNDCKKWKSGSPKISLHANTFEEFLAKHKKVVRTAIISWPINVNFEAFSGEGALVRLIAKASTVIYLGNNFNGTSCGGKELFNDFIQREVKVHVPHRWNTLIVYGKHSKKPRELLPEERAAYSKEILYYEDFFSSIKPSGQARSV